MDSILEIKSFWKKQAGNSFASAELNSFPDSVMNKIRKTERKVFILNVRKTIAVTILLSGFVWMFIYEHIQSLYSILGLSLIILSTLITMIVYWKMQFNISKLNFNLPQNEFIDKAILQMTKQKQQFVKLFSIFVIMLIIGINLLYIDLIGNEEFQIRLLYHLGISFFLLLTFFLGLRIRILIFKKEFQPLIDEMNKIKSSF
ncbi:MAG: hypothetical protein GXO79_12860 [Chlorobi bacterium]|nr:hypothetical protein [Chlorobiota bacterium]